MRFLRRRVRRTCGAVRLSSGRCSARRGDSWSVGSGWLLLWWLFPLLLRSVRLVLCSTSGRSWRAEPPLAGRFCPTVGPKSCPCSCGADAECRCTAWWGGRSSRKGTDSLRPQAWTRLDSRCYTWREKSRCGGPQAAAASPLKRYDWTLGVRQERAPHCGLNWSPQG